MDEPTDEQKALIRNIAYWRGGIITAYSQVEFLLADLSVKLDFHFPKRIVERVAAAAQIAERPGFEPY